MSDERFWRWPSSALWASIIVWTPALTAWFWLIYGGAWYITDLHSWRVRIHFDWELHIPFWPWTVLIYESILLVLAMPPFVLRSVREYHALAGAIAVCTLIAGVGFVLFPADHGYEPIPDDLGIWTWPVQFATKLNLRHYNMAPSLHVALAVVCLSAFARHANSFGNVLLYAWMFAIASSTLLLHQHHVIDVLSGALLGWVCKQLLLPSPPGRGAGGEGTASSVQE